MSECRYDLEITSQDPEEIKLAMQYLKEAHIVPEMLKLEAFDDSAPTVGLPSVWYSTEAFRPYGTIPSWDAKDHENFFNELSKRIPGATIVFRGEDIDAPEETKFKKAFRHGQFKEAYQEVFDLDDALAAKPWRLFGAPEPLEQQQGRGEDLTPNPLEHVDYELLYRQKQALIDFANLQEYLQYPNKLSQDIIEGLVNLLDFIGDYGEANGLFTYPDMETSASESPIKNQMSEKSKLPFSERLNNARRRANNQNKKQIEVPKLER